MSYISPDQIALHEEEIPPPDGYIPGSAYSDPVGIPVEQVPGLAAGSTVVPVVAEPVPEPAPAPTTTTTDAAQGYAAPVPAPDAGAQMGMGVPATDPAVVYAQEQAAAPVAGGVIYHEGVAPAPAPAAGPTTTTTDAAQGYAVPVGAPTPYADVPDPSLVGGQSLTQRVAADAPYQGIPNWREPNPTVASEVYGGPVAEPASPVFGNPGIVTTTYPAGLLSGARDPRYPWDTRRVDGGYDTAAAGAWIDAPPGPPRTYNWDAAEPGPPAPVPDTNPVVTPMETVERAIGDTLPNVADTFLGPYGWGNRGGNTVRAAQDMVGGAVLSEPEKPTSAAGQQGRAAGQTLNALIDTSAEGLVNVAGNVVARATPGVQEPFETPPRFAYEPGMYQSRSAGPDPTAEMLQRDQQRGRGAQLAQTIPEPNLAAAGDWLRENVVEPFRRNSADTSVFGIDTSNIQPPNVQIPTPGVAGGTPTHTATYPQVGAGMDPETAAAWREGMDTEAVRIMAEQSPESKAAFLSATETRGVDFGDGVARRVVVVKGMDDPQRGPLVVGVMVGGVMQPMGRDMTPEEQAALLAQADVDAAGVAGSATGGGLVGPANTEDGFTPSPSGVVPITQPGAATGAGGAIWTATGDTPATGGSSGGGGGGGGGGRSGGGGGGGYSSGGRSSGGGRSSSWRDFEDGGFEREFTADDFMDQAGGNRKRAEMMARSANRRRRSKRGSSRGGFGGGGFWEGFPFNRPPTPIRAHVLAAIEESKAAGRARKQGG